MPIKPNKNKRPGRRRAKVAPQRFQEREGQKTGREEPEKRRRKRQIKSSQINQYLKAFLNTPRREERRRVLPGSLRDALGTLPGRLRAEGGGAFGSTEIGVSASQRVQDRERTEDRQRRGKGKTKEETKQNYLKSLVFLGFFDQRTRQRSRKGAKRVAFGTLLGRS